MSIPSNITKGHIELAAAWIDRHGLGDFRDGARYEARVGTKWYPPKALVGHAAKLGLKSAWTPKDFHVGKGPGCAIPFLASLGIERRAKPIKRH